MASHFKHFLMLCGTLVALTNLSQIALAENFSMPSGDNALIGDLSYVSGWQGSSIPKIAQHYNVGVNALENANPGIEDNAMGPYMKIPAEFILPPLPRKGIIINLAEMRLYYFPKSGGVMTFPIGIGRVGKTIPTGYTSITKKVVNPTWIPPEDIRAFNRDQGIELPRTMGPGPDNPLGPYAIYLKVPTFLIHSTIFPESIGRRASFGCIRMHEDDIKQFFPLVTPGTPVAIVDIPNKTGWTGDKLFLETHPALEELSDQPHAGIEGIVTAIQNSTQNQGVTLVDWQMVSYLSEQRDGMPHEVGFRVH